VLATLPGEAGKQKMIIRLTADQERWETKDKGMSPESTRCIPKWVVSSIPQGEVMRALLLTDAVLGQQ